MLSALYCSVLGATRQWRPQTKQSSGIARMQIVLLFNPAKNDLAVYDRGALEALKYIVGLGLGYRIYGLGKFSCLICIGVSYT